MALNAAVLRALPRTSKREYHLMFIVGLVHAMSHYCQLVLMMVSSRLTVYFGVDTVAIGLVITIFYISSCIVQASSGFIVDKIGARPVMFFGLVFMILGLSGYALSTSYWMLFPSAIILSMGSGVFHPTDYTLLNSLISTERLGMAYSIHGVTGKFGWALTPLTVVPVAAAFDSWRAGVWAAVLVMAAVLLLMLAHYRFLNQYQYDKQIKPGKVDEKQASPNMPKVPEESVFAFLKLPVIWMCMFFFFFYALSNSAVQTFSKDAVQGLFHFSETSAGLCISMFMVASAGGTLLGGYLAAVPSRSEKIIAFAFTCSAVVALMVAFLPLSVFMVYVAFVLMGAFIGLAGPSRDLIVRRSTPPGATGRVFGVVYAGLDVGQAIAPLIYARLIDSQNFAGLFIALAIVQMVLITCAFNVRRVRRKKAALPA